LVKKLLKFHTENILGPQFYPQLGRADLEQYHCRKSLITFVSEKNVLS